MSIDTRISSHLTARIAGLGYLVIIAAGIFAEFFVRGQLVVPGDPSATARNIIASEQLFRVGIAGDLIMLLCDAVVAIALYLLLKPISKKLALLATGFRLLHTAVYGANLFNLVLALLYLTGGSTASGNDVSQTYNYAAAFLGAHQYGYALGLIFFGLHCMLLAFLLFKSPLFPRTLGVLIGLASVGYLVDSFARILLLDYAAYESTLMMVVFIPAFVAELSLCLWLLIKGAPDADRGLNTAAA